MAKTWAQTVSGLLKTAEPTLRWILRGSSATCVVSVGDGRSPVTLVLSKRALGASSPVLGERLLVGADKSPAAAFDALCAYHDRVVAATHEATTK